MSALKPGLLSLLIPAMTYSTGWDFGMGPEFWAREKSSLAGASVSVGLIENHGPLLWHAALQIPIMTDATRTALVPGINIKPSAGSQWETAQRSEYLATWIKSATIGTTNWQAGLLENDNEASTDGQLLEGKPSVDRHLPWLGAHLGYLAKDIQVFSGPVQDPVFIAGTMIIKPSLSWEIEPLISLRKRENNAEIAAGFESRYGFGGSVPAGAAVSADYANLNSLGMFRSTLTGYIEFIHQLSLHLGMVMRNKSHPAGPILSDLSTWRTPSAQGNDIEIGPLFLIRPLKSTKTGPELRAEYYPGGGYAGLMAGWFVNIRQARLTVHYVREKLFTSEQLIKLNDNNGAVRFELMFMMIRNYLDVSMQYWYTTEDSSVGKGRLAVLGHF